MIYSKQAGIFRSDISYWLLKQMLIARHLVRGQHARRHATHPHRSRSHRVHRMREVVVGICGRRRFLFESTELVFLHFKFLFAVGLLFAFGAGFVGAAMPVIRVRVEVCECRT